MRVVPERSPFAQLATVFGCFLLGPAAALLLSTVLIPQSGFVQAVAPIAFALIYFGGVLAWSGLGILLVVIRGLLRLARGKRPGWSSAESAERLVPPGYRSFVVLGGLVGALLGVTSGLVSEAPALAVGAAWLMAGLGYGFVLRAAAHHGYLPFPEPE